MLSETHYQSLTEDQEPARCFCETGDTDADACSDDCGVARESARRRERIARFYYLARKAVGYARRYQLESGGGYDVRIDNCLIAIVGHRACIRALRGNGTVLDREILRANDRRMGSAA